MRRLQALAGLIPGSPYAPRPYVPLCVVSNARSGTTLLQHLLNAHPAVLMYGEVFNRDARSRAAAMWPRAGLTAPYEGGSFSRYLYGTVFPPAVESKHVVGFKVFPYHVGWLPRRKSFWRQLGAFPGLRVLFLERENLLDIVLSHAVARRDSVYFVPRGESPSACLPIHIDYDYCVSAMQGCEKVYDCCRREPAGAERMRITYNELAHDTAACLRRVQSWLGLEVLTLDPVHGPSRQRRIPRREAIANFDELRGRMAVEHPDWLRYFDESEAFPAQSVKAQAMATGPSGV